MRLSRLGSSIVAVGLLALPAWSALAPKPATPSYERDILPLFAARCASCHGGTQARSGLDVRTLGSLLRGGSSGPALKSGSPEESPLYQMLADGRMPLGGKRFTAAELKKVGDWIRAGAPGTTRESAHWAFRSPMLPPVPKVKHAALVRNPVDAFLLASLEAKGLSYSPEADRRTLIRRLTYDLIGLPPTPAEVDTFLTDKSADAYEKLVDRLLASPQYGERWARFWLDPAGYADSEGVLQEDRIRPNMWRYRDYVIRSLNADKPYDRFLREQIAGDELVDYRHAPKFTPEILESLTATGFLRTAVDATRDDFNAHQYGEYQYRMLHDVQTIVFSSALGLTIQCARCHNHKYEPISQRDYYRVQALFMGAVRPRGKVLPTSRRQVVAGSAEEQKHAAEINAKADAALTVIARREAELLAQYRKRALDEGKLAIPVADRASLTVDMQVEEAKRSAEQKALVAKYKAAYEVTAAKLGEWYAEVKARWAELQSQRAAETQMKIVLPEIRAFYDLDSTPPPTTILLRGEWEKPGDAVLPGIPSVLDDRLHPFTIPPAEANAETTGRRKAFAEWLTRPEHPLTGRVMVNRLWAHHFGVGIVPSVENFGLSGKPSTHPELLDYLAYRFTHDSGWSLKAMHRLMVTSAAYRQSGRQSAVGSRQDPENTLLWRQRTRRLEAEAVRDGVLATAGTLDTTMWGDPVPVQARPTGEIVPVGEDGKGRRSIYLLVRRTEPVNLLTAFDAPIMETNCTRRLATTTPTQALALMNSHFITAQAGHFARRILKEAPPAGEAEDPRTIDLAFRLAFGREPRPGERNQALAFVREQLMRYGKGSTEKAYTDLCQALLSANEFVYID